MKYIIYSLIAIQSLSISCKTSNKYENNKIDGFNEYISLKKSKIVELERYSYGDLLSIKSSDNGIYLLFSNPNEIIHISDDMNVVNQYSADGSGPGEFKSPFLLAVSNKNIFVGDQEKMTVEIFDTSFQYIQTIQLNNLPTSLDVYPDEYLIVSSVEYGQSKIELYDSELLKTIIVKADSNRPLDIVGKAIFDFKGNIIFARTYINQVFEIKPFTYDIKEWDIDYLPERSTTTKNSYNMEIPDFAIIADVMKSEDKVLLLAGVTSNDSGQPIFSMAGNGDLDILYVLENPVNMFSIMNNRIIGFDPSERSIVIFESIK